MTLIYNNVSRFREILRNSKAETYPLANHPLAEQDEYTKGLYLKMLCMVVQYCEKLQEEQPLLLQRLIIGAEAEHNMLDYMRMALESDESFLFDFISNFRDHELKYLFVLDCLVVANCSGPATQEQHEFIAELSEQLLLLKNDIYYLSLLAQCILEQDSDKYQRADEFRPSGVPFHSFLYFTKAFVSAFISRKGEDFYISSKEKVLFDFSNSVSSGPNGPCVVIHSPSVYLDSVVIDTKKHQMIFSGEYVHLRNCEFIGSGNPVLFRGCKKVVLEDCIFRDFTGRTIIVEEKIEDFQLKSCTFERCVWQYNRSSNDWQTLGAVIFTTNTAHIKNCVIDNCTFNDCGGANSQNYYSSAIISNCICIVRNSTFINCWNRNSVTHIDPDSSSRTLFLPNTENENNRVIDSAAFSF
jgi:hypothetical protein